MEVEIQTPKSKTEVVSKFVVYHRGTVNSVKDLGDDDLVVSDLIVAEVPLAELENFPEELAAISKSLNFSYAFLEYRDIDAG